MVASWDSQFLFVFGGQGIGRWEDSLYRYRIFTDMWEDLQPLGVKEVKRMAFNYLDKIHPVVLDYSYYDPTVDDVEDPLVDQLCPDCGAVYERTPNGGHLPRSRGDAKMVSP